VRLGLETRRSRVGVGPIPSLAKSSRRHTKLIPSDYDIFTLVLHQEYRLFVHYISPTRNPDQAYIASDMAEQLVLRGTLEGHSGWVTSLATSLEKYVLRNRPSVLMRY